MAVQGVVLRQCLSSSITCRQPSPREKVLKKILHFLHPSGKLPLYALLFGCRMGCSMALTGCRIGEGFGGKGVFFVLFSAFSSCRKPADVERNVGKLQDYLVSFFSCRFALGTFR